MNSSDADIIVAAIKGIVEEIAPDTRYVPKYGGEVLATDPTNDKTFVGGMFVYKDHVSLEFSEGAFFDDPEGRLGGKGKRRRHLKFQNLDEVEAQDTRGFLCQALIG